MRLCKVPVAIVILKNRINPIKATPARAKGISRSM